ncbi:MAG TPA: DinB family protein [Longimicrobiales bacterium]
MDRTAELRELYAFNRWANARMMSAIDQLTPEEFSRDLKNSHPSVRDTVLHIMSSEWVWLARWLGTSPTGIPDEWQAYNLAQINTEWGALQSAQSAFVDQLRDHDLDRVVAYRNLKGEDHSNALWQLLRHMVNHSSYHRGQITTLLRQLGHTPVATDLVLYFRLQQAASI